MVVRYSHLKEDESEEFLINVRHKDNTERTFRNRMTVLQQDEAGKNYLILNVAEDITHVKRHEEELERQVEALNKSNRDLEQFAYVASHDLQEPLRKIIAFGERLSKKYTDLLGSEGQFFVERMTNAASRMHGLIEDLLVYSRASRQGETNTPISLNDIVKRVLEDLEIKIKEANAHIHLADLPTLEAQPTQMHQLF
ncbi:MAG: histidine kinase dimerization/phospho-acceptor domain-containing protein [Spirosomataceae bacterium]